MPSSAATAASSGRSNHWHPHLICKNWRLVRCSAKASLGNEIVPNIHPPSMDKLFQVITGQNGKEPGDMSDWEDKSRDERYREAQAAELMLRYEESNGRPAETMDELNEWAALELEAGRIEAPVRPRDSLITGL
jgi:hypothetical protein